uniref:Uncharacterized protein n=1 Tax=Lotharella globosa TaxID=91324 RepID=A0A7S3Z852_9EUKA|mmetsp:Transcript_29549/g.57146  ORF Transcript_29549/g.57146 Transcript_29549/m.57146 type:complete len:232 (+) Transcript_29549:3-698(+)
MGKSAGDSNPLRPASSKALRLTKRDYKELRVLFTKACLKYVNGNNSMTKSQQNDMKRVLKSMFSNVFNQVEKQAQIGGGATASKDTSNEKENQEKLEYLYKLRVDVPRKIMESLQGRDTSLPDEKDDGSRSRKPRMPSENSFAMLQDHQADITNYLNKLKDVLPGYLKGAENLLEYVQSESALQQRDLEFASASLEKAHSDDNSAKARAPMSKDQKELDRVSKSLRSGRWR